MSQEIDQQITADELWARLFDAPPPAPFFILDVRNEEEVKSWRVEGPRPVPYVAIPYFEFVDDPGAAMRRVPANLGEAVVVCAKGGSSEFVADVLRGAGRGAVNLTGGMVAWGDFHVPLRVPLRKEDEGRFELWQFNRYGKGCLSYAVIAGGEAAIIDPSRFLDVYERAVAERGARIVEVLETHVHADHLSGGAELARRNSARYRVLNGTGREPVLGVEIAPLQGDVTIPLGGASGVTLEAHALRTPGHTPGSTSYLVARRYLFSGDTLFVRGVGRPDLGGEVEEWSRSLHDTLGRVVATLADDVEVFPAHFSSHAEADVRGLVHGTLGTLRRTAPEFAIRSVDTFIEVMRAGVREPPPTYASIIKANLGMLEPGDKAAEWELGRNECAVTAVKARAAAQAAAST